MSDEQRTIGGFICAVTCVAYLLPMTTRHQPAATVSARITRLSGDPLEGGCGEVEVEYRWSEYRLTASWTDRDDSTHTLAAMTIEDAVAQARDAREIIEGISTFSSVRLSRVECSYTERTTFTPDTHEDGDGSPREQTEDVSGERWSDSRHAARNVGGEAFTARNVAERQARIVAKHTVTRAA